MAQDEEKAVPQAPTSAQAVVDGRATTAKDVDVALTMVGEEQHPIDPAVAARAVRKMDLVLMPAMMLGYGLVYYDKVNMSLSL